jgi:LytS/YehU family sensor histidine kinase
LGIGVSFVFFYLAVKFILGNFFDLLIPQHGEEGGDVSPIMIFVTSLLLTALVISVYEVLSFYLALEKAVEEKNELARQNIESQLEGLRNQVNPHFLFNSLNTLIYLIPEEPDKAVRFVQHLSKVYRYILESRDTRLIPMRDELDFLNAYVFLQKERFGDNLRVDLPKNGHMPDAAIVPLTLQMLFENAIKHNVISTEKPLKIEVFPENGHLVVRNNLQRKNQVMDSTGVGLQNIKDRYRILSHRTVEVITSQQYFTVVLPMLTMEKTSA